jgi:para-aminobenzoate synthetase/4-amino-4-deoxychorismate lyase
MGEVFVTDPAPFSLNAPGCVLIDDHPPCGESACFYAFSGPMKVIQAWDDDGVRTALQVIDDACAAGLWVAGYIGYDAGFALDRPMVGRHRSAAPLLWLGVYRDVWKGTARPELPDGGSGDDVGSAYLNLSKPDYVAAIARTKEYIEAGDVYQANLTAKLRFANRGTAADLFARLARNHPVGHSAFVNAGDFQVASLSPELFLRRVGDLVWTRPMKGTMARGSSADEDDLAAAALSSDPKNRAENLMIVDLMRNDLGRVCRPGSIQVPKLFQVERYRSVLQMTSDVVGELKPGVTHSDLLRATFPPGSVTGAPKLRAMEIIDELEAESRGPYCGCIGFFAPAGGCLLNVAIRTIVQRGSECEMGVGGGIVADSDAESEWLEVLLKGSFLKARERPFGLFETMRFDGDSGFLWLQEHLGRLSGSCGEFGIEFDGAALRSRLDAEAGIDREGGSWRVRVTVSHLGLVDVGWERLESWPDRPLRVVLCNAKVDSTNGRLNHKTTDRRLYDSALKKARSLGFDEVVFRNERDEVTEGAITNVFALVDGDWITPPVDCGLLPGVWRRHRLDACGEFERPLRLNDIARAKRVVIGNSVRGEGEVGEVRDEAGELLWSAP